MANYIMDDHTIVTVDDPYVFRANWNPHIRDYTELTAEQKERYEMFGLFDEMWVKNAMSLGSQLYQKAKQLTCYTFDGKHKERCYRYSDVRNLEGWYLDAVAVNKDAMMTAFEPRLGVKHVHFHGETFSGVGNPIASHMQSNNQREATMVIGATMRNFNATVSMAADIYAIAPGRYDNDTGKHHFYTSAKDTDEAFKNVSVNMGFLYYQFLHETALGRR